ncbi:hypothetical protein BGZ60DRAFT_412154 [Tricladium varicosporioides]|nr:hypothetical protein BGZ60DRAFT_412154 [Hymenoscyphus varicosporioides]
MEYTTIGGSHIVTQVCIKSVAFNRFLSINGGGMTAFEGNGGGSVTSTTAIDASSSLLLEHFGNGYFTVRVPNNPGAYLRLDASTLFESKQANPNGSGTANCQYYASNRPPPFESYELFRLRGGGHDGAVAIESGAFPGVFLRMDGEGVVNGQFYGAGAQPPTGSWEMFTVQLIVGYYG